MMAKVQVLSDAVASQVAAGEVVERPASIVKELIENSLDAGAKKVVVHVARGGISLIRITDDGCGMSHEDAMLCIERHATSKLKEAGDLASIATMGFRGEALPSIASVSRFRLSSRERGSEVGTELVIHGGKLREVNEVGLAEGTQVEVRSLFYNVPARRKFLRTEQTEYAHVEQQVRLHALAFPEVQFVLKRDEKTVFSLEGGQDLWERIAGLCGKDLAKRLLEVELFEARGMKVWGWIAPPGLGHRNRSQQLVFLNQRPIESAVLNHALKEGYHTALMKGRFPICFLFLQMDPAQVDVNVHPAKREVRFRDGRVVREVLTKAIQHTLQEESGVMEVSLADQEKSQAVSRSYGYANLAEAAVDAEVHVEEQGSKSTELEAKQEVLPAVADSKSYAPPMEQASVGDMENAADECNATNIGAKKVAEETVPYGKQATLTKRSKEGETSEDRDPSSYRLIGVLGKLYVLFERQEGMVLVDQHAAHERILFEQMKTRMEKEGVPTQALLLPVTVDLSLQELEILEVHREALGKLGVVGESFGEGTYKLEALPTFLKTDDPLPLVHALLQTLQECDPAQANMRLGEDMIAMTVCRHAVKANDLLRSLEVQKLLEDLLACEMPFCCPHGRPTLIRMSFEELEKKFGRVV